jgi:ClpP class serine protease
MSFDYILAREIYGSPWSADAVSLSQLTAILTNLQNGVILSPPETKLNSIGVLDITSETRLISYNWQLNNPDSFEGIGIINLNGVITKNGGASTNGTKQMSKQMLQMSKDSRIKGFIQLSDSGGGSSVAVGLMQDAINEVKKTKPYYTLVEKGGMLGSAAYGISSPSTKIFAEDGMSIIGSAGTMWQISGKPNGTTDKNGTKHVILYASKSVKKNHAYNEAIENDNYSIAINEVLDPLNENFLNRIVENRPLLKGTNYDNGHTVFAKDAIGTFIDGIASFDEVVEMILSGAHEVGSNSNENNNNQKSNKMTKEDLKSKHPDVYADILAEGATAEQDRVASWEAYREADSKAVSEGIASGKKITDAQAHQFQATLATKGKIQELKSDSAKPITTEETPAIDNGADKSKEKKEAEIKAAMDFQL